MEFNTSCNQSEVEVNSTTLQDVEYCTAPEWLLVLETIFLGAVAVGSTIGNSYILFLVAKFKALRYRSIIVSLSVVVADLLLGFFYILLAMVNASARQWVFGGNLGCTIFGFIVFYLLGVRWMVMGVIALDRFCYILFPLTYNRWSYPFLVVLTIIAWVIPVFFHLETFFGFEGFTFRPAFSHCAVDCGTNRQCTAIISAGFAVQILIGAILPIVLYTIMYVYSRIKKKQIRMGTQQGERENKRRDSGRMSIIRLPTTWSSRDINALVTFLLVFVFFLITNIPVFVVSLLRPLQQELYLQIPLWAHFIIVDLFYLLNVIDPLIIMRNMDFRKATMKLFCKKKFRRLSSSVGLPNISSETSS